jgi:hypothetical protein
MKAIFGGCAAIGIAWIVGCSAAPTESAPGFQSGRTLTIVKLSPDGIVEQKVVPINHSANDGISAQSLTVDPGCTDSDDWFFDQPANMGGNELCVGGTGTLDLSTVSGGSWADRIESYVSQASEGYLAYNDTPNSWGGLLQCTSFSETSTWTDTPESKASINYLTLGGQCPIDVCPTGDFYCGFGCNGYLKQTCEVDSQCGTGCNRDVWCEMHYRTCP